MSEVVTHSDKIRDINDRCRSTFTGCMVMVTAAFEALPYWRKPRLLKMVREFSDFGEDNDPHHEHDMGFFDEGNDRFFWKIDYYANNSRMTLGSDDPGDERKTNRVITIGLASDY